MATKNSFISLQSSKSIVFKHSVTTSTNSEFLVGVIPSGGGNSLPGNQKPGGGNPVSTLQDDEVESTFNISGSGIKLVCYAVQSYKIDTALNVNPEAFTQDGNANTSIFFDDSTIALSQSWHKNAVFEINEIPFSKITIKNKCVVGGIDAGMGIITGASAGSSATGVSCFLTVIP